MNLYITVKKHIDSLIADKTPIASRGKLENLQETMSQEIAISDMRIEAGIAFLYR